MKERLPINCPMCKGNIPDHNTVFRFTGDNLVRIKCPLCVGSKDDAHGVYYIQDYGSWDGHWVFASCVCNEKEGPHFHLTTGKIVTMIEFEAAVTNHLRQGCVVV